MNETCKKCVGRPVTRRAALVKKFQSSIQNELYITLYAPSTSTHSSGVKPWKVCERDEEFMSLISLFVESPFGVICQFIIWLAVCRLGDGCLKALTGSFFNRCKTPPRDSMSHRS